MLFFVLLSIALMILDARIAAVSYVRNGLSTALVPLQYVVSAPIQFMDKIGTLLSSRDALVRENLNLKTQELILRAQVQRFLAIESENNQLKALFRSSAQIQGRVLIAQLLAVDTDPFIHQVSLDKGSRDGLFMGQPVLDANGVMGKVIQISAFTSRVLLINDSHSGVPVQITRNGMRAIAMGDGYTGKLRLVNIPKTADIRVGDILVTSGLGEHYPQGYPLGTIISVAQDPAQQFMTIIIEPNAHLDRSREVLLVWPNRAAPPEKKLMPQGMNTPHV